MIVRYESLDPEFFRDINRKKLTDLFLELLNRTSQDVNAALEHMERIWEMNHIEEQTGISFEEFREYLEDQGLIQENTSTGRFSPTRKGDMEIQKAAFEEVFAGLRKDMSGNHPVPHPGAGGERLPETRPWEFGDSVQDIDFTRSIGNALLRSGGMVDSLEEDDLETHETEHLTSCATVILIDISHSMTLYGEDRITPAKKVAMALIEYINQRYPKDVIDVVLFGDDAVPVEVSKVARIDNGPFHTNTKAGLQAALKILQKRKQANKQVFMITDGKPSAIWEGGMLYKNPFGLDPKIVAQTVNEAAHLRRKGITLTTFMITSDPYLQEFVDTMTQANKGRAYFATLDSLGKFIFADYARNKKKRV
ncbi:MAG: VWA domain-containing protein [Candidatus Sumerlaeia bacterium]|nr:VWA domain-containing protein [Candidatus Sumerlaeia bacterium]